jgi:acyl-lipid omega-6 desaturase (Delta-12 desaturase)
MRALVVDLHNHCKAYMMADDRRAWWQVISTALLFFPLVIFMLWLAPQSTLATLLLAIPAGGLLVRFFALQHDCGHGMFFSSKNLNERIGQLISILTFTPYDHWRRSHAMHHAGSGNLDRRGFGDLETRTVREYMNFSKGDQWRYWALRHPLVSLLIGPPVHFLILQRFAIGSAMEKKQSLPGIMWHNLALFLFYGTLIYFLGLATVAVVVLPTVLVAAWIGGWLFFVQHQFEETLWEGADKWDVKIAALKGSSHLKLHPIMNWLTCDIGLYHIHHLSSRIPNYKLRACLNASDELQKIAPTLTFWPALKTMHLALWDEATSRLISFHEFRQRYAAAAV